MMLVVNSWACGVILFTLLAGSPPFWHRKQMLMLRMIMEGRYQFSSPEWDDRSDTVKDLVSSTVFALFLFYVKDHVPIILKANVMCNALTENVFFCVTTQQGHPALFSFKFLNKKRYFCQKKKSCGGYWNSDLLQV